MQIAPTAIKTEVCQVFDESPTPRPEGFSSLLHLEYYSGISKRNSGILGFPGQNTRGFDQI